MGVAGNYVGNRRLAKLKNKPVSYLLVTLLLTIVLVFTACGATAELGDGEWPIPHDPLGLGFKDNCLACHTGGLKAVPPVHATFPLMRQIEDETINYCATPECHPVMEGVVTAATSTEEPQG